MVLSCGSIPSWRNRANLGNEWLPRPMFRAVIDVCKMFTASQHHPVTFQADNERIDVSIGRKFLD